MSPHIVTKFLFLRCELFRSTLSNSQICNTGLLTIINHAVHYIPIQRFKLLNKMKVKSFQMEEMLPLAAPNVLSTCYCAECLGLSSFFKKSALSKSFSSRASKLQRKESNKRLEIMVSTLAIKLIYTKVELITAYISVIFE